MDVEKIQAYRGQQVQDRTNAEEKQRSEALDLTIAEGLRNTVINSNHQLQQTLIQSIQTLANIIQAHQPKVSVTNQKDFPSSVSTPDIKPVVTVLREIIKAVNSKETDFSEVNKSLDKLSKTVESIPKPSDKVSITNQIDYSKNFKALQDALDKKEFKPVISVDSPKVNVEAPDLSGIETALTKQIDLSDYKAQDLDEMLGDIQYVGFINPKGNWYIIRNDIKKNELRYKFGKQDYSSAWALVENYNYKLLNEAYDEITS